MDFYPGPKLVVGKLGNIVKRNFDLVPQQLSDQACADLKPVKREPPFSFIGPIILIKNLLEYEFGPWIFLEIIFTFLFFNP